MANPKAPRVRRAQDGSVVLLADDDFEQLIAEVPDEKVDVVLEWVGGVPRRAEAALEVEQRRTKPRTGLVEELEELIVQAGKG